VAALPESSQSLLVRTDFTDPLSWNEVVEEVGSESEDGFRAYVKIVNDPDWAQASWETLLSALPVDPKRAVVLFVVDEITMATAEHPILVVDVRGEHPPFRCIPSELWGPDNNLNIANMDFDEFADSVDSDGIFRGFATPGSVAP
jgi:hypothetical protein